MPCGDLQSQRELASSERDLCPFTPFRQPAPMVPAVDDHEPSKGYVIVREMLSGPPNNRAAPVQRVAPP